MSQHVPEGRMYEILGRSSGVSSEAGQISLGVLSGMQRINSKGGDAALEYS